MADIARAPWRCSDTCGAVGCVLPFEHPLSTRANESDETGSRAAGRTVGRVGGKSPHVPGALKQEAERLDEARPRASGAAVQPMWQGVTILSDPYSRSAHGEVVVSAILLANFAITRAEAWFKQQAQTSA